MAEHRNTAEPIATERLTPGGQAGPGAMDWALRASLGLLALSAVWFVVVLVKPMPSGQGQAPPSIPALATIPSHTAPIEERQRRLAALDEGGNIFAADRMNWPVEIVRSDEPAPTLELTSGRGAAGSAIPVTATVSRAPLIVAAPSAMAAATSAETAPWASRSSGATPRRRVLASFE